MAAELHIKIGSDDDGADKQPQAPAQQAPPLPPPMPPAQQQPSQPPPPPRQPAQQPPAQQQPPQPPPTQPAGWGQKPKFVTNPPRKFTEEQWEAIPEEDREAVSQAVNMGPPEGYDTPQKPAKPPQPQRPKKPPQRVADDDWELDDLATGPTEPIDRPAPVDDAKERSAKQPRKQRPLDDAEQELAQAYKEEADERLKSARQNRQERQKRAAMSEDDRVEHDAQKEAKRQEYSDRVKQRAKQLREDEEGTPVQAVPEAKPLHDEAAYRRQVREEMATRERNKRLKEVRQEMDPEAAQEEADRENRKRAQTVAMGGAAIGGTVGRMMGIASQVMSSPAAMKAVGSVFGKKQPQTGDDEEEEPQQQQPPPRRQQQPPAQQQQPPQAPANAQQTKAGQPPTNPPAKAPTAPVPAAGPSGGPAGGAGGAGGAGAMAAASEAVPIVGAVMAGIKLLEEKAAEIAESNRQTVRSGIDMSKNAIAMDADHSFQMFVSGVDSMADQAAKAVPFIGLITPAAKEFVHGIDEMRHAVKSTADRLGQYHAGLATQNAMQEVQEIMRDINRANRFGQTVGDTNAARFNMEQRLQDLSDRFVPFVMKFLEKIFGAIEKWADGADVILTTGLKLLQEYLPQGNANLALIPGAIGSMDRSLIEMHRLIREALDDGRGADAMAEFERFLNGGWADTPAMRETTNQQAPPPHLALRTPPPI